MGGKEQPVDDRELGRSRCLGLLSVKAEVEETKPHALCIGTYLLLDAFCALVFRFHKKLTQP
jgi:hypothetical protein